MNRGEEIKQHLLEVQQSLSQCFSIIEDATKIEEFFQDPRKNYLDFYRICH